MLLRNVLGCSLDVLDLALDRRVGTTVDVFDCKIVHLRIEFGLTEALGLPDLLVHTHRTQLAVLI